MTSSISVSLLRAEAQRLWREPRLRWVALLAPLLLVIVFASSWHNASRMATERQQFAAAERARWLAQGVKDPHSAAHFGVWAVKPSSPLLVLAPSIEPFVGLSVWLEAHKRNEMIFRPNQDADPIMRSAASVAQILEVLGPIFAILLGFAGFAQDQQRGTLRMALGNGATPSHLLLARFCVMVAALVCMALAPVIVLGGFALATLPDAAGWNGASRLVMWSILNFLYLLIFLLISLTVSLKAPSARAALTIMLVLWLLLCVVMPRAACNAIQVLAPVPSYQEVRSNTEREAPAYESAEKWEARRLALLKANTSTDKLRAAQLDQSERDSQEVFDLILGRFYDAVEHQHRTFGWLGAFTPTVALQASGAAIAGTDFQQHRHFIDAAETYRRNMVNRLNGELLQHKPHTETKQMSDAASKQFWESIPAFNYRAPSLSTVLASAQAPLLLLFAWCVVASLAAWRTVKGVRP